MKEKRKDERKDRKEEERKGKERKEERKHEKKRTCADVLKEVVEVCAGEGVGTCYHVEEGDAGGPDIDLRGLFSEEFSEKFNDFNHF